MTREELKERDRRRQQQDLPKVREYYERRERKRYSDAINAWKSREWL